MAVQYFITVTVDVTGQTKEVADINAWVCRETGYGLSIIARHFLY